MTGARTSSAADIRVAPLTAQSFVDLEVLFTGPGCSFARGCWCMDYRLSGRGGRPEGVPAAVFKKAQMRELTRTGPAPGLLGYDGDEPVAWVSLGPRESFARLRRSPIIYPVDDVPVWSVVCFVTARAHRGEGLARSMLGHAVDHAARQGAIAVEGYPVDKPSRAAPQFMWHGSKGMFDDHGFVEIARRKPERPVMRRQL